MSSGHGRAPRDGTDRYRGFSLRSVCWGYRDIFSKAIDGLFAEGLLGGERTRVTDKVFELLKRADQTCYDHVLKEFLGALNPRTRWLLDIPEVFADVVNLGSTLGDAKLYYGIEYFRALGQGALGQTPAEIRLCMDCVGRLLVIDHDLAFAFIKGFRRLCDHLSPPEIHIYLDHGIETFSRNRAAGIGFMECTLKSAEVLMRALSRECRLGEIGPALARLLRALVGHEVEVSRLSALDSDFLLENGTRFVCMHRWLYAPDRVRYFDDGEENRQWYLLLAVVGAGAIAFDSFSKIHGHRQYQTIEDVAGGDPVLLNCLVAAEYARVLRRIRRSWPGARGLIEFGIHAEFDAAPAVSDADRLAQDLMCEAPSCREGIDALSAIADRAVNVFDAARQIGALDTGPVLAEYPRLGRGLMRCVSFLPDWRYPGEVSIAPPDQLVADMKAVAEEAERDQGQPGRDEEEAKKGASTTSGEGEPEEAGAGVIPAGYVYDEWSQPENDYYRDFCIVRESRPDPPPTCTVPADLQEEAAEIRRLFERLKPQLTSREKRLEDGDFINPDHLLEFLVERRRTVQPSADFYERVRINRRDIAVSILLDVSGSTGESQEAEKVIDLEKRAALALGHGLAALGDTFSICGFSGSGRENCTYFVYKDFDAPWDRDAEAAVWSAHPVSSTRIGPALRHSGHRLSSRGERQRLIILITDGKPMDTGYDPATRYAQHDVRMACIENERRSIHTIGISTDENTVSDMEIMFPHRRFVILPDMARLPGVLPRLYVKMAV